MTNGKATFTVVTLDDWEEIARELLQFAGAGRKFLLYGEVGAGKTTLVQAVCRQLGVHDPVQSPTFSLINEYWSAVRKEPVFHADLYRLRHPDEAIDIGLLDLFDGPHFLFIEWPEIVESYLIPESMQIRISTGDNSTRKIVILRPDTA